MTRWTARGVARALELDATGLPDLSFTRVATDTRTLAGGELFAALGGERFDAHRFLEQARDAGARGAVVRRGTAAAGGVARVAVDDTLGALGALARARGRETDGPAVAGAGAKPPAVGKCNVSVQGTGTIFTKGQGGPVTHQWVRGGQQIPVATVNAAGGKDAVRVTLTWQFKGQGTHRAVAVLNVFTPNSVPGQSASFTYSCAS